MLLVQAAAEQLAGAIDVLDDLAELRRPHEPEAVRALDDAAEQAERVYELAERVREADENAPAVCVLDTGVHQHHPLLSTSLQKDDQHTCHPTWGLEGQAGHGTEMAGLALFGDLGHAMTSTDPVAPAHRLESVKLLPHLTGNPPHRWGALTATAASRVEVQAPTRWRTFSMAVTAPDRSTPAIPGRSDGGAGRPTSWSPDHLGTVSTLPSRRHPRRRLLRRHHAHRSQVAHPGPFAALRRQLAPRSATLWQPLSQPLSPPEREGRAQRRSLPPAPTPTFHPKPHTVRE